MTTDTIVHATGAQARRPHPVLDADSFGARSRDGGSVAPLTVLQYALLHHLAYLPPGKVATWIDLAIAMRPYDKQPLTAKAIQWHAGRLRGRLSRAHDYWPKGAVAWPFHLIATIRGRGLRLDWSIETVQRPSPQPSSKGRGGTVNPKSRQTQSKVTT